MDLNRDRLTEQAVSSGNTSAVSGSNHGPNTDYPDRGLSSVSSVAPKFRRGTSEEARISIAFIIYK